MSSATMIDTRASSIVEPIEAVHRFSVEDYHRMIDAGLFVADNKVELLDGIVVKKMGHNPPHSVTLCKVLELLGTLLPANYVCRPQLPVTLSKSEPEPDIAVVLGPHSRYDKRHPGPKDIGLLVEIADDSLWRDQGDKVSIYSLDRIPEYWIVNLVHNVVEVYAEPRGRGTPKFHRVQVFEKSQKVPLSLHGKSIGNLSFRDILP